MRTDRTFVCTDCRVRCWPVRRCPACGETKALVDLEQEPERISTFPTGMPGASHGRWPVRKYDPLGSPIVRARARRASKVGLVRPRGTLTAPLSGRECVAWRLVAEGRRGVLDDACGVPFRLSAEDGSEVEVDATIASIDLPVPDVEAAPLLTIDAELAAWLRARAVDPSDGPLLVREAILQAGDAIEVIGTSRRETRADGYRGSAEREIFSDVPGSPLIVRPPVDPEGPTPRSIA